MSVHLPASIKGKGKNVSITQEMDSNIGGYHIGTHGGYTSYKSCTHDGSKVVYTSGDKAIYGSSWQGLKEYSGNWNLIIDLASNIKPAVIANSFIKTGTSKLYKQTLDKYVKKFAPQEIPSDTLCLDWSDMGIPPVEYDFWVDLWAMMPAKTVIACMGGHGRTGTCMTALLIIDGLDYWTALETVRKEHCNKAVESMKQEEYLYGLYLEYLNRALDKATVENRLNDVSDLNEDIKYAIENTPTSKTTTATKQFGSSSSVGGDQFTVQPNEEDISEITINGQKYIKECVDSLCSIYSCTVKLHQRWILPASSLYLHVRTAAKQ